MISLKEWLGFMIAGILMTSIALIMGYLTGNMRGIKGDFMFVGGVLGGGCCLFGLLSLLAGWIR